MMEIIILVERGILFRYLTYKNKNYLIEVSQKYF